MYGNVIPRACFIVLTPALPPWTFPTMSPGHDLGNWIEYIAFLTLCAFNWNEFPYLFLRKTDILCSFGHSSGVKGFPKSGNFCVPASSVSLPLYNKWSGNRQHTPGFSLISTVLSHGLCSLWVCTLLDHTPSVISQNHSSCCEVVPIHPGFGHLIRVFVLLLLLLLFSHFIHLLLHMKESQLFCLLVTPQMPLTARLKPSWSQKARATCGTPTWGTGTQVFEQSPAASQDGH